MHGKAIFGSLAVTALMGGIWGYNLHDPDTQVKHEVRTVKVPKIITHVEEKEVVKNVGFPETCETAIDLIHLSQEQTNEINNLEKKLADPYADSKDHMWHHDQSEKLDELFYEALIIDDRIKVTYDLCLADTEKAKNGDDITVADGHHVTSP